MAERPRLFVVARVGWSVDPDGGTTRFSPDTLDRPGEDRRFVPVAAFAARAPAEGRARELEREAARAFNPFWRIAPFRYLSTVPEPEFRDRLAALVGSVPAAPLSQQPRTAWLAWWDEHAPEWPDDALAAVWELFDGTRFYAVLEVEAGDE